MESEPLAISELAKALCQAQALMGPAIKDKENPFFKSSYADLASVWEACREPLTKNGLSVAQLVRSEGPIVKLTTMLIHSSGQYLSSEFCIKAEKETPQGMGSAITYARRYALAAIVGISSEDDDGNGSTPSAKPEVKKPLKKNDPVPEDKTLAKLKVNLTKAQKLLGDESFFAILGQEGIETIDQVTNTGVATQLLRDMETAYRLKNGK